MLISLFRHFFPWFCICGNARTIGVLSITPIRACGPCSPDAAPLPPGACEIPPGDPVGFVPIWPSAGRCPRRSSVGIASRTIPGRYEPTDQIVCVTAAVRSCRNPIRVGVVLPLPDRVRHWPQAVPCENQKRASSIPPAVSASLPVPRLCSRGFRLLPGASPGCRATVLQRRGNSPSGTAGQVPAIRSEGWAKSRHALPHELSVVLQDQMS